MFRTVIRDDAHGGPARRIPAPSPAAALTLPEIQQADPDARAQAIRLLAAGAVIGAALIAAVTHFEALIQDWLLRHLDDLVAHPGKVNLVGLLVVAPLLVMALYLFRFGRRVAQAARMP
ncbi:MAG: hypothetical protein KJO38_10015, partial [Gammaproteobacteria bacterium]|nr:hypothetical protein [Gammaproteobacteria bacterium]